MPAPLMFFGRLAVARWKMGIMTLQRSSAATRGASITGRGVRMAAMKPRTGDGPLEVTKEGRGIVMRVPLEGGGRLVVELNADEAKALGEALDGSRRLTLDLDPRRRPQTRRGPVRSPQRAGSGIRARGRSPRLVRRCRRRRPWRCPPRCRRRRSRSVTSHRPPSSAPTSSPSPCSPAPTARRSAPAPPSSLDELGEDLFGVLEACRDR